MSDTQTSSKRAEANRRNAQKSTGPRTAEGKARSRFNAVKHGLRAATPILPGEDGDAFQARMAAWTNDLKPGDDVERFLVGRAVQLSWQLERADRALADRSVGTDRLDDLADEVAALGRRLLWDPRGPTFFYPQFEITLGDPKRVSWSGQIDDPDDPVRLVNRLESSALGCAWLLDRWDELRVALEAGRNWEPRDRFKAIRLLGRQPLDIDDDGRVLSIYAWCTAMDETGSIALKDLTNELHWNEQKRLADWINRRWAEPEDRPDAETAKAALLALVSEEETRLEDLLATLLECPPTSCTAPEFDASDAAERLRRYQATCDRSLLRILEALRKRRRNAGGPGSESRRSTSPAREATTDPLRGLGGLLGLIAAARSTTATNEPMMSPGPPPGHGSGIPADRPGRPDAARTEPEPGPRADEPRCEPKSDAARTEARPPEIPSVVGPTVTSQSRTNEPNVTPEPAARPAWGLLPTVLAAFVLFLTAAVAVAAVSEKHAPALRISTPDDAPPRRSTHPNPASAPDIRNLSWFPAVFSPSMARRMPIRA
jgi:hypothetical protein